MNNDPQAALRQILIEFLNRNENGLKDDSELDYAIADIAPIIREAERAARIEENERHLAGFSLVTKQTGELKLFKAVEPIFKRRIERLQPPKGADTDD